MRRVERQVSHNDCRDDPDCTADQVNEQVSQVFGEQHESNEDAEKYSGSLDYITWKLEEDAGVLPCKKPVAKVREPVVDCIPKYAE